LSYDVTSNQILDISFDHRELSGDRYFDQHNSRAPVGFGPTSISDRHSDGYEWSMDDNKAISLVQNLGRPHETLTFAAQRGAVRERERYAYKNTYSTPVSDPQYDHLFLSLDLIKTQFSLDYDLPLTASRELRLGVSEEADQNAFDNRGDTVTPITGALVSNPDITNHFRYRQAVHAAYVDFQTPLGPYNLDAGARLEATHVTTRQITVGVSGGYDTLAVYPTLNMKRSLSDDDTLIASIARRINRPDPESLNPFADHQDTHNLRAGNPDLRPQETWSVEAGYAHEGDLNYAATVYFRQDRNSFTEVVRPISEDVFLTTKANLPRQRSGGLEFSARGKLGPTLSYGISGVAFQMQIDPGGLGSGRQRSTSGLNLKLNLDYRPTAKDTAQVSFNRTDRRLTPQGQIDALNLVNLGYKHDFRPDLSLVFTVSDLLNSQRTVRRNSSPSLVEVFERHQYGRIAYVGLTYAFGGPKKGKSGFDYEQ
jgi:outer membrane receptor protein involved in Fe transport